MELHIDRLRKHYKNKIAADRISLSLEKGVHGLPGANGAGKTTLLRMICGILRPDSGTVTLGKADVSTEEYRSILGYLPQDFGYYPGFTAEDFLMHMAALKELRKTDTRCCTGELLSIVGLEAHKKQKIKTFSGGMKQRLGIAQALLNRPKLLICDEPTSALDPAGRKEILDILLAAKEQTTVFFSTHILSDVERICTEAAFLNDGKIAMQGTISELRNKRSSNGFIMEMEKKEVTDTLTKAFRELQHTEENVLVYQGDEDHFFDIMKYISENKIPILKIERIEPTLESLFLEVTK